MEPIKVLVVDDHTLFRRGIAAALGCQAEIRIDLLTPAVVNDAAWAGRVSEVAGRLFPGSTIDADERSMVSEDFAYFLQAVPGCFVFIGSANPARGLDAGHHNPHFDFDEAALPRAAALLAAVTWDWLERG